MISMSYNPESKLYTCSKLLEEIREGAQTTFQGLCKAGILYKKSLIGGVLEEVSGNPDLYGEVLAEIRERNLTVPRGALKKTESGKVSTHYREEALSLNSVLRTTSRDLDVLINLNDDRKALAESIIYVGALRSNDLFPDYPLLDHLRNNRDKEIQLKLNIREDN